MSTEPRTCQHRERTAHFEWKCTLHEGHGGRGHFLAMARPVEEAS